MIVALDVGQTHVRSWVVGAGDADSRTGDGFAVNLDRRGAVGTVADQVVSTVRMTPGVEDGPVDTVCVGLSGFDVASGGRKAGRVARAIAARLPARRVIVASDDACWYLAAFGCRPGVVASVGTGTVILACDGKGAWKRVDGYGYLLGDDGSGFAVGREGIRSALRAADGRGGSMELLARAEQRFGPPAGIPGRVFRARRPVAEVAGFARDVAEVAEGGDPEARAIWIEAARDVVASVVAGASVLGPGDAAVEVACLGAMFVASDALWRPFQGALRDAPVGLRAARPETGWGDDVAVLLATDPYATRMLTGLVASNGAPA